MHASSVGDPHFEEVYDQLRSLARRRVQAGLAGHSLDATGLVHEVWLKLSADDAPGARDRSHYYATAAQAMRWILVDRARRRVLARAAAEDQATAQTTDELDRESDRLLALDDALARLEQSWPRPAQVVLHRHFAGLSIEDTAKALEISPATVKREWSFARAWLLRTLAGDPAQDLPKG